MARYERYERRPTTEPGGIVFSGLRSGTVAPGFSDRNAACLQKEPCFRGPQIGAETESRRVLWQIIFARCVLVRVAFFSPIDSELLNNLRTHGWKYQGSEAETCNHRNYSCPHCGATDRDRLYALYLTDYLPAISSCSALKLVDFAPSPPLSDFIRKLQLRLPYRLSYVTADLFRPDVDDKVDITDMKIYKAGSFDFLFAPTSLNMSKMIRKHWPSSIAS